MKTFDWIWPNSYIPVRLVPTQGCYQKEKAAILCGETRMEWRVQVVGESRIRRFRKADGMPVLRFDALFPCYKLVLPEP